MPLRKQFGLSQNRDETMSLKGHLGTIALPELLQWLAIGQKTGTLVIVKDDGVHRVVVDRGRIISTNNVIPNP